MKSERWQSCTEIFHLAVEQPPLERVAILDRGCRGDEPLRRQVELLLKYHDASGDFIIEPAFASVPGFLIADPKALIGQHLGSYRVDAVAGVGGMGVVYLARDERLGRKVALKLLPPALAPNETEWQRLQSEARAASALNHPNIVTVHEIGQVDSTPYVATEFVEGVTLRERMRQGSIPPNEAVEIAIQIASALEVAHRAGVVHRDIKPENIILRPDGYVKVLDFGIAKVTPRGMAVAEPTEKSQRKMVVGTARYISPEQAQDETLDGRTDFWSLGVVLYEMLAGCAPFAGATSKETITAVLLADPPSLKERAPGIPAALRTVVARCLQKNPDRRDQSASELLSSLRALKNVGVERPAARFARWLGWAAIVFALLGGALFYAWRNAENGSIATPVPTDKSIAVLPFENLSTDPDSAFLAAALHDDVVTSLAKIKDLKVIARGSVLSYRGEAARAGKLRGIGAALGVANLLQGSVRRSQDHMIVNLALIDARNQEHKWAQHYERTLGDSLHLQGELALDIARELRATLTPIEATGAAAEPTKNTDAYLLYLRARELEMEYPDPAGTPAALRLYQQAVDLDPNFALARAHLSLCASLLLNGEAHSESKEKARAEAEAALRLRPNLGEAWLASAHCSLWGDRDYDRALRELARAAELLPNSVDVSLTAAFIYKRQLRYRDRIAALEHAEALDPLNRGVLTYLSNTFRWVRNWSGAIQTFDRAIALAGEGKSPLWRWRRANDAFRLTGDIGTLDKAIADEAAAGPAVRPELLQLARYETALLKREYAKAADYLAAVPAKSFHDLSSPFGTHSRAFNEALLSVVTHSNSSRQKLEAARREMAAGLYPGQANGSGEFRRADIDLALLDAFLGRKDDAIHEAFRAVDLAPGPAGGIEKNLSVSGLAMVYAQTGELDKAIALIEHLLTEPCELQGGAVYNLTLTDLKWRWQWDPLRRSPRFQKILAAPEPATVF